MDLHEADDFILEKMMMWSAPRSPPPKKKTKKPSPNLKNCGAKEEVMLQLLTDAKRPGPEADHSLPSRAKAKNAWSYTSTPS